MGLIKSDNVPVSASPFSMADIEQMAKGILLRARQQADQLLAAAQTEGEQLKSQAAAEGFVTGQQEGLARGLEEGRKTGRQLALDEFKAQFQQTVTTLSDAATMLNSSRSDLESRALTEVVKLAISIARRVTKRQGLLDPQVLAANLEEAMNLVAAQTDVHIAIHPSQRNTLDASLPQLALKFPVLQHVKITEDSTVSPGGCKILTCHGSIDADLDTQLDRIVADLLPDAKEAIA